MKFLNPELNERLALRKLNITKIATILAAGETSLSLVLNGRRVGTPTWRRLGTILTKEEYDCARWHAAGNLAAAWIAENGIEPDHETASYVDLVRRYILAQKTRDGRDNMRLPRAAAELSSWAEQENKTPCST